MEGREQSLSYEQPKVVSAVETVLGAWNKCEGLLLDGDRPSKVSKDKLD